ncbi:MAG: hypothetical protein ACK4Q5_13515 [Saprospiraceae bacterium]
MMQNLRARILFGFIACLTRTWTHGFRQDAFSDDFAAKTLQKLPQNCSRICGQSTPARFNYLLIGIFFRKSFVCRYTKNEQTKFLKSNVPHFELYQLA